MDSGNIDYQGIVGSVKCVCVCVRGGRVRESERAHASTWVQMHISVCAYRDQRTTFGVIPQTRHCLIILQTGSGN